MRRIQKKRMIWMTILALVMALILGISNVQARANTFQDTESSETEENQPMDLLETEKSEEESEDSSEETNEETAEETAEETENTFSKESSRTVGTETSGLPIVFENGIHYIQNPEYPNERITLFCMNNNLRWPHGTSDMGKVQVPNYVDGYLTPDNFSSTEDYNQCMRRLSKLLYAGYPYNGEGLYKIVENTESYIPTEEEFNEMLVVPPALQKAFPYLGHHVFTYKDWVNTNDEHSKEHLELLSNFLNSVLKLYPDGQTETGLSYSDITSMPFYKASYSMLFDTGQSNPLQVFALFYPGAYFVTEEQAYNATQKAVWRLLQSYGIPDNDISNLSDTQLGQILYTYSESGELLNYEPSFDDISLSGSLDFSYNPKDHLWHSGVLKIIEPDEYHGIYHLDLPEGMTAECDNLSYIYGNEEYELVLDHEPTEADAFGIHAEFIWLKELKQYSPERDITVNGTKFQHMVGAVIRSKTISANISVGVNAVGSLTITKKVVGEVNCQEVFEFDLVLKDREDINGQYGDLVFHNGIASFGLKDNETKTAENLPVGTRYEVIEYGFTGYQVYMTNNEGVVIQDTTISVTCTNTKCPDLTLTKIVTGEAGDKTKKFTFVIHLLDKDGKAVNGTYKYIGSVKQEYENQASSPGKGTLTFENGIAEISLAHGQQITLQNLPPNSNYKVIEKEANQERYTTTYDGKTENANGVLNTDVSIEVVNHKEFVPDTGIKDANNQSGAAWIAFALIAIGLFLVASLFCWRREWMK